MNALTAQETSIVSAAAGTTTDAVSKAMELLPFGPVVFVDTAGLDDQTELGAKRAVKTAAALAGAEIKTAVADARYPIPEFFDRTPPTVFVLTRRDEVSEENGGDPQTVSGSCSGCRLFRYGSRSRGVQTNSDFVIGRKTAERTDFNGRVDGKR